MKAAANVNKNNPVLALIDGDILIYRAVSSTEHPIDWGGGLWTLHGYLQDAIEQFEDTLAGIIGSVADHYKRPVRTLIALSDRERNFRKDIWPEYKANRKAKRDPLCRWPLYDYVVKNHKTLCLPTLEADDVLGIEMTKDDDIENKVIVSIDKDLKTIPGDHYDFNKDEFFNVSMYQANYWHMLQTLTGDQTDGYPGCPGVGPVTAEKILDGKSPEEWWDTVKSLYVQKKQSSEMALIMARLAFILRAENWNFEKGEMLIQWFPWQIIHKI